MRESFISLSRPWLPPSDGSVSFYSYTTLFLMLVNVPFFLICRNEMSVAYNIQGTSTIFTSSISQKTGAKAGFETLIKGMFADVRNKDGLEMFPGVPEKFFMLMGKQFPISH